METHELHTAELDVGNHVTLRIKSEDGSTALTGTLGSSPGINSSVPKIDPEIQKTDKSIIFKSEGFGILTFEHCRIETNDRIGHKYTVSWELTVNGRNTTLTDGFSLDGSHWYGGAQIRSNEWPLEKLNRRQMPYVAGDSFADQWGGVQERYWLNSKGVAIFVENDVPLFVSLNSNSDRSLSLVSKWSSPYRNINNKSLFLKYSFYQGSDVRMCHEHVLNHVFSKPSGIPDELMFRHPIWSTWARYKTHINHDTVMQVSLR